MTDVASAGLAIALLTSHLRGDYHAFKSVVEEASPDVTLDSCVNLAGSLASRAAAHLKLTSTGEYVADDVDGGIWQVIAFAASLDEDPTPDNPAIGALTSVYRARDAFLNSLAHSLGDVVADESGTTTVTLTFWEGWNGDDWPEVLYGIGSALQRLFFLAGLVDMEEADDASVATSNILDELRQGVAADLA